MAEILEEDNAIGFTLFNGLPEDPYGMLPLANLSAKNGPTSMKQYKRITSYNWYLEEQDKAVIVTPGAPLELTFWGGGLLPNDEGVLIYDVHHAKLPGGPLDPIILCTKHAQPNVNFQEFDIISDAVNLQKLFAFCKAEGEGLFRIDVERVGKTILLNRVEASDFMQIDYETYDQHLKMKCCKSAGKLTNGPHFQIVSSQFGQFKLLLRHEVDCIETEADAAAAPAQAQMNGSAPRAHFEENEDLEYIDYGRTKKNAKLYSLTTYPHGAGFPFFTWAQLFFTGADAAVVGWYKGHGDFGKAAIYPLTEVNKLIKPIPYTVLGKVHDCLMKVVNFMRTNSDQLRVALVWKGGDHIEIYQRNSTATSLPISHGVRTMMRHQVVADDSIPEESAVDGGGQSTE